MDQCNSCGATLSGEAAWCGQCYAPRGAAVAPASITLVPAASAEGSTSEFSIMSGVRKQAAARPALPMVRTRWRKTPTTFGPIGRVFWTVSLILPLPPMIIGTVVGIIPCVIGLGIWVLIIMPRALRDIWKAGQLPAG